MDAEEKDAQDTDSKKDESSVAVAQKPSEEEKKFSQKEVDEQIRTRHGKLDSRISSLEKQLKSSETTAAQNKALQERLTTLEKERDEIELKAAEDNPDLADLIKRRRDLDARERGLAERESDADALMAEFEDDLATANEADKRELARELATEFTLSAETILSFPSETPEQMREIAKNLAGITTKGKESEKTPEQIAAEKAGMKPDSGAGRGGTTPSETERLKTRYPSMYPK